MVQTTQQRDKNGFYTLDAIRAKIQNWTFGMGSTNLDPITYNPRYPGFDKANYEKLEAKIAPLGLTGYQKEQAMDELYNKALPIVQNEIKNSDRRKYINQSSYEASQLEDSNARKRAQTKMTVVGLTQELKEKFNIDPAANDEEVFNSWIESIPNGEQLLVNYLNDWNPELLYVWGLDTKKQEKVAEEINDRTFGDKVVDFWVGVAQSPGKWGYNMIWQRMDKLGKAVADKLEGTALAEWVRDQAIDAFWEDEVRAFAEQRQQELADGTAFKGKTQTDIMTPILWEERANSKSAKAWEIVWDIGTAVALSYPLGAALAPAIASWTPAEAALLWAFEGGVDTLASQYGSQWNLDITPTQAVLWFAWGALGGWLSNKLANLPKTQQDSIRKEASQYIEKSIKPTVKGKQSQAAYDKFIDDTLDVTDYMSKNKQILQYTDDAWDIVKWELPKNLRETSDALSNLKKYIYDQYNSLAKQAWDNWAKVNLNKVYEKLDDLANNNAVNLANPWLKSAIESYKNQLLQYSDELGNITIQEAQDTMQYYNKILDAYFKNPWAMATDTSKNIVVANLKKGLADAVDDSMDDALNSAINNWSTASQQYRDRKLLYSKIKTIEDEVSKRALVEARKNTKGLSTDIIDALAWGNLVEWLLTQNPTSLVKSIAMKSINAYNKYLNSPNTQIRNLFGLVDKANNPTLLQNAASNVWTAMRWAVQNAAPIIPSAVVPGVAWYTASKNSE